MYVKTKFDSEALEIERTLLQDPENLLKPDWVYNSSTQFLSVGLSFNNLQNNMWRRIIFISLSPM